jgi:hypothetical protein
VRHPGTTRHPGRSRRLLLALVVFGTLLAGAFPGASVALADGLTMEARVLLDGHARTGSWVGIEIHVRNDGPAISGELRISGGTNSRTQFGMPVELPTLSDKTQFLYAQPPAFGRDITVSLVEGGNVVASTKATFQIHDATQLTVGIVAERPGDIVGSLHLLPNQNNVAPVLIGLTPADLPERVEAWGALDRLVWQDTDSSRLNTAQLAAMRGWVAGGGRLVIAGGTAGPATLSAFPDALLPYRPAATTDIAAASLAGLLGAIPPNTADLPALTGDLNPGARALVESGDRVVAAELSYGSGSVTIVGFDPTVSWIGDTKIADGLWRRLLPTRASGGLVLTDDSQIVQAASQLPSLALPPIGGLIALLVAYILLIGPINYLVLKRLDRREWAWVTMPILIVAFAAGAYTFGSLLRGSDLIVNEVAIVRGAPGATEGTAQAYVGIFSPSRGTYQIKVPGGALLSTPLNGDFFGGDGSSAALDVLQGDPARIRDLGVSFGSLRTVRAEMAVPVPLIQTDIQLADGRLKGSVTNGSTEALMDAAVVLGGTVAKLDDLDPGETATFDVAVQAFQMGQQLSDIIVGPVFFGDPSQLGDDASKLYARHTIIDQLTFDPNFGNVGQLPSDGAVVVGWADHGLLPVEIEGQEPRRTGNVLYFLPAELAVRGATTFRNDLLRSTVIASDSLNFSKDPYSIYFGRGAVEMSYRPIAFEGTLAATELAIGLNFGGEPGLSVKPTLIEPLPSIPEPCPTPPTGDCAIGFDGLPEVEVYDLTGAEWKRLPHLNGGSRYALKDPTRYVDPASGTVLVRFVNDHDDGVGFSLDLAITGDLK